MAKISARYLAIKTLHQLTISNSPLPVLFQQMCNRHRVKPVDRSLAMNLIYGVLRQQQYLESLLQRLCRPPLKKLHPLVKKGLLVGLYQVFFLERIPHSAAVNETVEAVKNLKVPRRLHGFVNGVLRESIRQISSLPTPEDARRDGGAILNHPAWLISRWQKRFGTDTTREICCFNNLQQPLTLRVNTLKSSREEFIKLLHATGIAGEAGGYSPYAVKLPGYQGQISAIPGYGDYLFQVQGEAAQLASLLLLPIVRQGRYLDGCAGLGTKTAHLLELLAPAGAELVAVEPQSHRFDTLETSLNAHESDTDLRLFHGELQDYCQAGSAERFHGILLDAPCSGTGVIGRQPDIRWRRRAEEIPRYATIQRELLETAVSLLLPGGVLVYATCSLEPEENKENIQRLLEAHPELTLTDPSPCLPKEAMPLIRDGFFQPLPADGLDGFFAAKLVRSSRDD